MCSSSGRSLTKGARTTPAAPSRSRWPCRTMAWAQGDLTSSLSIIVALAACLSATTSEGRERGGLGATGQRWEGHRGSIRLGCSDVSSWALLAGEAHFAGVSSPCSQGSRAPGSCLPEFANPRAFAQRLNFEAWARGLDLCSSTCPLCLSSPGRALLQRAGVAVQGTRPQEPAQPWSPPWRQLGWRSGAAAAP